MARPLFQLSPRLALCARLVSGGRPLCDVGTDHAYLPIWLLKSGKVPRAVASDVNPGPLGAAAENAGRYHVLDRLDLRLSDGLREIAPEEAQDIVIAGMGGELVLRIIEETPWLRDTERQLVLQPMSSVRELRLGLKSLNFAVREEYAVIDSGKVYTAFSAGYIGTAPETDRLYPYLGKLKPGTPESEQYAEKILRDLYGRMQGALRGRGEASPEELRAVIEEIENRYPGSRGLSGERNF